MRHDEFLAATLGASERLYSLARQLVRTEEAAQDLVQETYLRAFESWGRHRHPDRPGPWLATICLNAARSRHRRDLCRPLEVLQADAGTEVTGTADTAAEALASLERSFIRQALWDLPEEQRIAIALMDLCQMTAQEVAEATGSPRGTVLSRVHRGRKALASRLGKEVDIRDP